MEFINLIKRFDNYVIYTWAGGSADFPQLRSDLTELGERHRFSALGEAHIDLYKLFEKCIALPIYTYSIKEVIPYLGIPDKETKIKDGFACLSFWQDYLRTQDIHLKEDILEYNLEDLKKLIAIKDWTKSFFTTYTNVPVVSPYSNSPSTQISDGLRKVRANVRQ